MSDVVKPHSDWHVSYLANANKKCTIHYLEVMMTYSKKLEDLGCVENGLMLVTCAFDAVVFRSDISKSFYTLSRSLNWRAVKHNQVTFAYFKSV